MLKRPVLWILFLATALISCSGNQNTGKSEKHVKLTENQLIQLNKGWVDKENAEIDNFIKQKKWNMVESSTGLRYMIYHYQAGEKAKLGKVATIAYTEKLLDGTVIYSSAKNGLKSFVIGHSRMPAGLEEGIILLKVGEKAKFILPSRLAYGLSGDGRKIPPNVPIIFDVELIQLK